MSDRIKIIINNGQISIDTTNIDKHICDNINNKFANILFNDITICDCIKKDIIIHENLY